MNLKKISIIFIRLCETVKFFIILFTDKTHFVNIRSFIDSLV